MRWQKRFSLSFVPLLSFLFWLSQENQEKEISDRKRGPSSTQVSPNKERKHVYGQLLNNKKSQDENLRNRIPQSISQKFQKDPSVIVTRGHELLMDIGAIPRSKYTPQMGELILEQDGIAYFRTVPGHDFLPVARSKMTDRLYPVSNIVHINKVTPEIREKIRSEGFTEHYYHPQLEFLSIKASPGEVLKVYSDLREMGVKVQLEVIGPRHQPI